MKKLLTLLMILSSSAFANFELSTSFGEQSERTITNLSLEKRVSLNDADTGLFVLGGVNYSITDYKSSTSNKSSLSYDYETMKRKDTSLSVGAGYDFGRVDILGYASIGNSKLREFEATYTRSCGSCDFEESNPHENKENELFHKLGFRVGYEFGNRDINPYFDYSTVKYSGKSEESNFTVGISLGF